MLRQLLKVAQHMAADEHGASTGAILQQAVLQVAARHGIQPGGGFVQHQKRGAGAPGQLCAHPLQCATGQAAQAAAQQLAHGKNAVQCLWLVLRPVRSMGAAQTSGQAHTGHQIQHLAHAQVVRVVGNLGHVAHPQAAQGIAVHGQSLQPHQARVRSYQAQQALHERGLAGTIGPDEGADLPPGHIHADALERLHMAEALGQLLHLDHRGLLMRGRVSCRDVGVSNGKARSAASSRSTKRPRKSTSAGL